MPITLHPVGRRLRDRQTDDDDDGRVDDVDVERGSTTRLPTSLVNT
jgi:hypothetical protein